ncbi:flagellin-specific chaperone FliT [Amphibacillus sediminis]|uniref:flagellin-specific chaperone FliT n=1 Tax=Amphibacillus sediminis TaxID=360185 RepID=UPI000835C98B|nr:flagellin-specific chaperone FliT [Amphibacillus sediminis]
MDALTKLEQVTNELATLVDQPVPAKTREDVLAKLDHLLDQRSELLKHVKPPFTDEEQKLGHDILAKDQEIQLRLNHLFLELKHEMRNVKKQKSSTQQYLDPYRHVATHDGSYWDKKN